MPSTFLSLMSFNLEASHLQVSKSSKHICSVGRALSSKSRPIFHDS